MTKQIVGGIEYAVNMINTMVEHDQAGAMKKWVNGIVKSWLVRMLETIADNSGNTKGVDGLSEDGQKLIIRAVMAIPRSENRAVIWSTCLHHEIIPMFLIPPAELNNVTIKRVD